jgi:hypothetical protein
VGEIAHYKRGKRLFLKGRSLRGKGQGRHHLDIKGEDRGEEVRAANWHDSKKGRKRDWWALVPSGALVPNFSKFFVALYLGHIKSKLDQPKAFLDQLTELYLISLNLKSYDHFENF